MSLGSEHLSLIHIFLAQKQRISQLGVTIVAEHMQDIRCSYKARPILASVPDNQFRQCIRRLLGILSQTELNSQYMLCLGMACLLYTSSSHWEPPPKYPGKQKALLSAMPAG